MKSKCRRFTNNSNLKDRVRILKNKANNSNIVARRKSKAYRTDPILTKTDSSLRVEEEPVTINGTKARVSINKTET